MIENRIQKTETRIKIKKSKIKNEVLYRNIRLSNECVR
jgi:hypothetical protein